MRKQRLSNPPDEQSSIWQMPRIERSKSKRTVHGGVAWSLPDGDNRLKQPQDGAHASIPEDTDARMTRTPAREPEDAGITGGTRSLMRRVMGLNVTARPGNRKPARPIAMPNPHAHVA